MTETAPVLLTTDLSVGLLVKNPWRNRLDGIEPGHRWLLIVDTAHEPQGMVVCGPREAIEPRLTEWMPPVVFH